MSTPVGAGMLNVEGFEAKSIFDDGLHTYYITKEEIYED